MRASTPIPRDRVTTLLLLAATTWSVLILLVGSLLLTPENGRGVMIILSMPLFLIGLSALALARRRARHKVGPGAIVWTLAGLTSLLCLLGILTIGIFLVPVAVLLFIVCGREQERGVVNA
jgi:hypothetical protein